MIDSNIEPSHPLKSLIKSQKLFSKFKPRKQKNERNINDPKATRNKMDTYNQY